MIRMEGVSGLPCLVIVGCALPIPSTEMGKDSAFTAFGSNALTAKTLVKGSVGRVLDRYVLLGGGVWGEGFRSLCSQCRVFVCHQCMKAVETCVPMGCYIVISLTTMYV